VAERGKKPRTRSRKMSLNRCSMGRNGALKLLYHRETRTLGDQSGESRLGGERGAKCMGVPPVSGGPSIADRAEVKETKSMVPLNIHKNIKKNYVWGGLVQVSFSAWARKFNAVRQKGTGPEKRNERTSRFRRARNSTPLLPEQALD